MLGALAWASLARASIPLPAYDDQLVQERWHKVNRLIEAACEPGPGGYGCAREPLLEAIQLAQSFQDQVTVDARLEYLIGLAYRGLDDGPAAERHLRRSVELDPERTDAWHDLGEVLLDRKAYPEAKLAFTQVDERVTRGSRAWVGPFRLAEVAAWEHDPEAFEAHLRTAIKRGFSFRLVLHDPDWRTFAADPEIGPSVSKLVTVYGTAEQLKTLRVE